MLVAKKVEIPVPPGFHSHGHTALVHHPHAKEEPHTGGKKKPSTDDMIGASLQQDLKAGGARHRRSLSDPEGGTKGVKQHAGTH
jgi:hypothetical protein